MYNFLVQRLIDGENHPRLMTLSELIDYISMDDCHCEEYLIYDIGEFGAVKKLTYAGWKPGCVIELCDEAGTVVYSGIGVDH